MKHWNKMSLGMKIGLGFGIALFLSISIGCYSVFSNLKTINFYTEDSAFLIEQLNLVRGIQVEFKKQVQEWKDILLRGHNLEDLKKYKDQFVKQHETIEQLIAALENGPYKIKTSENRDIFKKFVLQYENLQNEYAEALEIFTAGSGGNYQKADSFVRGKDRAPTDLLDEIVAANVAHSRQDLKATKSKELKKAISLGIILFVGSILSLLLSVVITRYALKPVKNTVQVLSRLSDGDMTQRVEINTLDEIGTMSRAVNLLSENLSRMIGQIQASADQLMVATRELSFSSQKISDGAQQQSASFEELSSSVQKNAENAQSAQQIAQRMIQDTEKAWQAMENNIEAMSVIENGSKQMAQAVAFISEIAEQTNLLALNAAIEAARAGESGKGFAVVADEVRILAERSATGAKEIQGQIKNNLHQVELGVVISKEINQIVHTMTENIRLMSDQLNSVAEASQEQASSMEQNTAITESNATSSEQMAASAEEMSSQSEVLTNMVTQFKISEVSS